MAKLRPRKTPVYKLVYEEPDGRLVSAIVRRSHPNEHWAAAAKTLQRVYRSAPGRFRTVRQAAAFDTETHAWQYRTIDFACDCLVWEARCDRAKEIDSFVHLKIGRFSVKLARLFARLWGDADGWTSDASDAPVGTLLCENLRLVRRLEP